MAWASIPLIWFLRSIGVHSSNEMTLKDVSELVNQYAMENNLFGQKRENRKTVTCDQKLCSLLGTKKFQWNSIDELLKKHFTASRGGRKEMNKAVTNDSKKSGESSKPSRTLFAAIVPSNIKLVYLRASFVEQVLLEDLDNFEANVIGCFIRIRCDSYERVQKSSHQLLRVTGIKKRIIGTNGSNQEILLQASGIKEDIPIRHLSDGDFSVEECDFLRGRVQKGLITRPKISDIEQKVEALHQKMKKHWIERELFIVKMHIERAGFKGWRGEFEKLYFQREKLQKPEEQARILNEIPPQIIADDIEYAEFMALDDYDEEDDVGKEVEKKPKPAPAFVDVADSGFNHKKTPPQEDLQPNASQFKKHSQDVQPSQECLKPHASESKHPSQDDKVENKPASKATKTLQTYSRKKKNKAPDLNEPLPQKKLRKSNASPSKNHSPEVQGNAALPNQKQPNKAKVSKEENANEDPLQSMTWMCKDSKGTVKGPYSLSSLKDLIDFFNPGFKIWNKDKNEDESALLVDVLRQYFPN